MKTTVLFLFLLVSIAYAEMPSLATLDNINTTQLNFKETSIGDFKILIMKDDINYISPTFTQHFYLGKFKNTNQLTSKSVPSFTNSLVFSENLMKG